MSFLKRDHLHRCEQGVRKPQKIVQHSGANKNKALLPHLVEEVREGKDYQNLEREQRMQC